MVADTDGRKDGVKDDAKVGVKDGVKEDSGVLLSGKEDDEEEVDGAFVGVELGTRVIEMDLLSLAVVVSCTVSTLETLADMLGSVTLTELLVSVILTGATWITVEVML